MFKKKWELISLSCKITLFKHKRSSVAFKSFHHYLDNKKNPHNPEQIQQTYKKLDKILRGYWK